MQETAFYLLARSRRSCRSFRQDVLDDASVRSIPKAGWLAPHVQNLGQEWWAWHGPWIELLLCLFGQCSFSAKQVMQSHDGDDIPCRILSNKNHS